jgi:hypothetical protein
MYGGAVIAAYILHYRGGKQKLLRDRLQFPFSKRTGEKVKHARKREFS